MTSDFDASADGLELNARERSLSRWVLSRFGIGVDDPAGEPAETVFASAWRDMSYPHRRFAELHAATGPWTFRRAERDDDGVCAFILTDPEQHEKRLRIGFDDAGQRVDSLSFGTALPPGVSVRHGTLADEADLLRLESQCPILMGDDATVQTVRANLRDILALQKDYRLWVAELDGRIVGSKWWAVQKLALPRGDTVVAHNHLILVHPSARGKRLGQAFNHLDMEGIMARTDTFSAHIDAGNTASRNTFIAGDHLNWKRRVRQVFIACGKDARPAGRVARASDASRLAQLKNLAHADDAMFPQHGAADFLERLSRAPEAYGWDNVLIGDRAFVGVWPSREQVVERRGAKTSTRRLATVLDYGFEGLEGFEELKRLIAAAGATAARSGATHLMLLTSAGAVEGGALSALGENDEFFFRTGLAEPSPAERPGLYSDPLFV